MGQTTTEFVRFCALRFLCALLTLLILATTARSDDSLGATADTVADSADAAEAELDEDEDDLDSLLDMDLDSLSQAQVSVAESAPTFSDPIVESVSKAPEKVSEAPGIVDVITAEDIRTCGAKNLYEVLQRATSVFMTGSYFYPRNSASIRGNLVKHEDNHVLILVNGRPFRETTGGGINWAVYTAFPIQTIQRIEVTRGPGSVLYGTNAYTGVINIVTKKPYLAEDHASTLAGSDGFQRHQLASSAGCEHQGLYVGATYLEQDGWPFSAVGEDALTTTGPYGEESIGVFTQFHRNGFTAHAFLADARQTSLGSRAISPLEANDNLTAHVDFGYLWDIDEYQSLQVNFTYSHVTHDSVAYSPGPVPISFISNGYLAEMTYGAKLTDRLDIMLGALADTHEGRGKTNGQPTTVFPAFTETWYGVYMQLNYHPTDWLKVIGGMQGNMPGEIPGGIVPRAGFITSFTDEITCKFLYGQAFRSPYHVERNISVPFFLVGNPDLRPETIQTFDLQLAYTAENYRLAGTMFHSEVFDAIQRIGVAPQTYTNAGRRVLRGFELENDWRLSDRWSWTGSGTYVDSQEGSSGETSHAPPWMAKMGIAYQNPDYGLRMGLFDTFYGRPQPVESPIFINPDQTAYHLLSLNSTLNLNRFFENRAKHTLELQFLVQNLLDEDIYHIEFERELINALPAGAGRTYYGGVTLEY